MMSFTAISLLTKQILYLIISSATWDAKAILSSFVNSSSKDFYLTWLVGKLTHNMLQSNFIENFDTTIGTIMLLISFIGIMGNLFTLCFLPRDRSSSGKLVYSLAIFDLTFLVAADLLFTFPLLSQRVWENYLRKLLPLL